MLLIIIIIKIEEGEAMTMSKKLHEQLVSVVALPA
jgi:hypothetical protein